MSKMVQIRNVPDAIHKVLKIRAAQAGMPLSDFLLRELRIVAQRPTLEEIADRIQQRRTVRVSVDSASAVRHERNSRR